MSTLVFPSLPGVRVVRGVVRSPTYRTTVLTAWSGKEVRLGRQTTSRVDVRLQVAYVRSTVNGPNETGSGGQNWTTYTELAVLKYFHDTHKGSLDTFHLRDPDGGADMNVRFQDDKLPLTEEVAGVWSGELDMVTVL